MQPTIQHEIKMKWKLEQFKFSTMNLEVRTEIYIPEQFQLIHKWTIAIRLNPMIHYY